LIGPVLSVAADRQAREADAQVTYLFGAEALDHVLAGLNTEKGERSARVAASKALALTPRSVDDDDGESAATWFAQPPTAE